MGFRKGSERLDKALAAQTSLSRRDVHRLLSRGLILVNGVPASGFDTRIDLERDDVIVEGRRVQLKKYSYLMLNKPKGVVSATGDAALPTVLDLVPEELRRSGLFPAGRLDKDTEGFVLITNDGEFAHRILSPRSHVPKVYTVELDKPFSPKTIECFAKGLVIKADKHDNMEGTSECSCLPAQLGPVEDNWQTGRVVIRQGMYHQVKRMFAACGLKVMALKRIQIGGLALDPALEIGKCREITEPERLLLAQDQPAS
ncbi:pseudouridine synthase [Marasmitruncus massiliensis]|uniref:pseudouridine synthase n=1 Tax=Marasmitruncus massiliensis TaxID=1944642 RepID=UPI000C7E22DB|nr:pseudouridine synthase [Marasmitruncus massiliensis]